MKKPTIVQEIVEEMKLTNTGECHSYRIPSLSKHLITHIDINKRDGYYDIFIDNGYPCQVSYDKFEEVLREKISEVQEIGRYVIGNVTDDTNRVFIDRISRYYSATTRDGWWDVFSLSESTPSIGKGRYVFSISRFTEDKDGYPIVILKEVIPINLSDEAVICMAINSRKFISTYRDYFSKLELAFKNYDAVSSIDVFEKIMNGTFDEKEFLNLLNSKTPDEIDIDLLIKIRHDQSHPLYAKINRMGFSRSAFIDYIYRIRERYNTLNLGSEEDIVTKAIAVEKYYNDLHKAAKEKKKMERKNKKAKKQN